MQAVHYPDKWLRLIGTPVLAILYRHIGEAGTLGEVLSKPIYFLDISVSLVTTLVVWEIVKRIILSLDARYNWHTHTAPRIALQASLTYGIIGVLLVVVIFFYNGVLMKAHRPAEFKVEYVLTTDVPIAFLFITIIQLAYAIMYLVAYQKQREQHWQGVVAALESQAQQEQQADHEAATLPHPTAKHQSFKKNLLANHGKAIVPLPTDQIAYFFKINDFTFIKTIDEKEYTIDYTLEQLGEMLPPEDFYRVNRQVLAHFQAIKKAKQDASGKLVLDLLPPYTDEVSVSKKKASEFKTWITR